jgi:hypothetical protein
MKEFESSGDAYDATQCDNSIQCGDLLVVKTEAIVGLAWTWPIAVTVASGELHSIVSDPEFTAAVIADTGWTQAQIRDAVSKADELGFPVEDWARQYSQQ